MVRRTRACEGENKAKEPLDRPRQMSCVFVGAALDDACEVVFFLFFVGEASLRVPSEVKSREIQERLVTRAVSIVCSTRALAVIASKIRRRCLSTASERRAKRCASGEKWDRDVIVDAS